jgi:hypothetical protein
MKVPAATGRTAEMSGETHTTLFVLFQSVPFFSSLQVTSCDSQKLIDTRIVKEDEA